MIRAFAILVAVVGCIPYGILIAVTLYRRRWRKFTYLVAIPVVVYTVLFLITAVTSRVEEGIQNHGVFGVYVNLSNPKFEYDSPRSFNGDGYSITIYTLPLSIRKRFENADQEFLTESPKPPLYRHEWFAEHWRRCPFDQKFDNYLSFALSEYGNDELNSRFSDIRKAMNGDQCYYSFFAQKLDYVSNIDFFIVDLESNLLYIINHNT